MENAASGIFSHINPNIFAHVHQGGSKRSIGSVTQHPMLSLTEKFRICLGTGSSLWAPGQQTPWVLLAAVLGRPLPNEQTRATATAFGGTCFAPPPRQRKGEQRGDQERKGGGGAPASVANQPTPPTSGPNRERAARITSRKAGSKHSRMGTSPPPRLSLNEVPSKKSSHRVYTKYPICHN